MVLPSDYLHIPLPDSLMSSSHISISPSFVCAYDDKMWFPQICKVLNGVALFKNTTDVPLVAPKYAHFRPHPVIINNLIDVLLETSDDNRFNTEPKSSQKKPQPQTIPIEDLISSININRSILSIYTVESSSSGQC